MNIITIHQSPQKQAASDNDNYYLYFDSTIISAMHGRTDVSFIHSISSPSPTQLTRTQNNIIYQLRNQEVSTLSTTIINEPNRVFIVP